jgi:glucans biosynthesis protein C
MLTSTRRYDIDWLRVIAIGLLLIYHIAIGFQPWGIMIGFITNKESWPSLWIPMTMLNVWRIPFLFFVSGMGVYFAMQHRGWKALIQERFIRILIPYIFGAVVIFPLSSFMLQYYYEWDIAYSINGGHLWFLRHIFVYVIVFSPIFYVLKSNLDGKFVTALRKIMRTPLGLLPATLLLIAEALLIKPYPYELYATTWHGFVLGAIAFFCGFCFILSGDTFWSMIIRWRWMFVAIAAVLFYVRAFVLGMNNPLYLLVVESNCWIFSVFAFGSKYLNRPGKVLAYLSEAAYPVYILHMVFLFLGSMLLFPLDLHVYWKFAGVFLITFGGCFAAYELIRLVSFLRPLFGLKWKKSSREMKERTHTIATINL